MSRVDRIRAVLPPDGADLKQYFAGPTPSGSGLFASDVEVRFVGPSAEMGGQGEDEFFERWRDWLETWDSYRVSFEEIVDQGERIVTLVRLRGVTSHAQVEVEHEAAAVYTFGDDDLIVLVEFYIERDRALAG